MSNFHYDTYCGIYCGACDILVAYKNGQGERIAPYLNVEASQVKCHGCKTETVFGTCGQCKIRNCARENKIEHCIDCDDYPCNHFNELKNLSSQRPHLKILEKNLSAIKDTGVDKWLKEQEDKWQCPECRTNFTWYLPNCVKCGKDLDKIKDYNNI